MSEQWLSIVEYARTYAISDMTVRRRIKTGRLKAVLREGKYYIPVHEVGPPMLDPTETQERQSPKPQISQIRNIVKAHPSPKTSYTDERDYIDNTASRAYSAPQAHVPSQIRANLPTNQNSVVETQTLLAFCDNALRKLSDAEQKLEEHYKTKIMQLEAQIRAKDLEVSKLFQQVEDLQVLVKILEKKQK